MSSRGADAVAEVVATIQAEGFPAAGHVCDVGNADQLKALGDYAVAAFGHFDIWINNAAISGPYGPTLDIPPETFECVMQTNIMGTYHGSRVAMMHFLQRGGGKLVNLLGRGYDRPAPYQNAYGSTKAWLREFTLALAKEYKESGVNVFAFNPGIVDTDLLRSPSAIAGYEQKLNPLKTVMRLWANPPEIPAQRALLLVSPATDGKTGLEVNILGRRALIMGMVREVARRLTGRKVPPINLDITTVQPVKD